jgi:hypothetical protein
MINLMHITYTVCHFSYMLLVVENPAVRRINETITVKQGQSTTIKFYGSGIPLPYPGPDDISWQLNDVLLQSDTFSSNKKSLTIHNVQPSDHGVYRFTLTKGSNEFTQTASDTTMLVVLGKLLLYSNG